MSGISLNIFIAYKGYKFIDIEVHKFSYRGMTLV